MGLFIVLYSSWELMMLSNIFLRVFSVKGEGGTPKFRRIFPPKTIPHGGGRGCPPLISARLIYGRKLLYALFSVALPLMGALTALYLWKSPTLAFEGNFFWSLKWRTFWFPQIHNIFKVKYFYCQGEGGDMVSDRLFHADWYLIWYVPNFHYFRAVASFYL